VNKDINRHAKGVPWHISEDIFKAITATEIDSTANRDYLVIQLDYFPHTSQAAMTRSQLYAAAKKR
jgi:hypothetical protein